MQQRILQFLEYLADEKNCSSNTIAAYRNDVTQFYEFLQEYRRPDRPAVTHWRATGVAVQAYLLEMKEREYASSTIARKIAAVKSFMQYLNAAGVMNEDPSVELDSPKVKKNLPRAIAPDEIERLLAAPAKAQHGWAICATRRCWKCSTPAACASPSWSAFGSDRRGPGGQDRGVR
ncbi:MAG: site-specific integrase [Caldilineaceae bacterium]